MELLNMNAPIAVFAPFVTVQVVAHGDYNPNISFTTRSATLQPICLLWTLPVCSQKNYKVRQKLLKGVKPISGATSPTEAVRAISIRAAFSMRRSFTTL